MCKARRGALAAGVVLAAPAATVAMPSPAAPAKARSSADHPHGPSPALRAMLREIDARRVKSDIRRSPASARDTRSRPRPTPTRGIGAARDWIYDQFQGSPRRRAAA